MKPPKELKLKMCDHTECVPECDECGHGVLRKDHQTISRCRKRYCYRSYSDVQCESHVYRLVPETKKKKEKA